MKKRIWFCLALMAALAGGCSSTPETKVAKGYVNPALEGAPAWVLDPSSVPGLAAVGSAQRGLGGLQFQRNEAMASGRDELARMLSLRVKNSFENFAQQTGVADSQTFDKVTKDVSKQLANETLTGSKQKDLWLAPDGTMWILVALDPKSVSEVAKQRVVSSLKNENAKYQQAEAKEALAKLEADIDKAFNQ